MVATISAKTPNPKLSSEFANKNKSNNLRQNPKRPPLLPSEAENGPTGQLRRPKSREVGSRYLSASSTSSSSSISTSSSSNSSNSISSRRSASPMVSRTVTTPAPQNSVRRSQSAERRSQSAERRRPATPRPSSEEMSSAAKLLMTSKRSLSVSFQGESFSTAVSKAKPAPSPSPAPASAQAVSCLSSARKATPERRKPTPVKDRPVNSNLKPSDQQRWPGRSKPGNSSFLTRSLDYGAATEKARINGSLSAVKPMQKSTIDVKSRLQTETRFEPDTKGVELEKKGEAVAKGNLASSNADALPSDSERVSSDSTTGIQECGSVVQSRGVQRGIIVPARFWQETNSRLRRVPEPGSPVSKNNGSKIMNVSKLTGAKKKFNDSPVSSPNVSKLTGAKKKFNDSPVSSPRAVSSSRGLSSPLRGITRPSSPNMCLNSSINSVFRGMPSPTRMRNGVASLLSNDVCGTPSILSFAADMRRGKVGENRIEDAHELRLLYNRQLQWRFANARADTAQLVQTETAERNLYNAWVTTSKLWHSVKSKRMELQLLSLNLRLFAILNEQVPYLDNWDMIERDHCTALSGAVEALESSTVCLPVVGGARADIQDVKNAVYSAIDVMQGMASSICSSLPKVEQVNTWISELASLVAKERALIDQSKELLSKLTELEVKDSSLRAHILQLRRLHPVPVLTTKD